MVLFSRTHASLDETAAEIVGEGKHALSIVGDVSREEDVHVLFRRVMDTYGRVDILVNCAGVVAVRPFVEMDAATWDHVLGVNLRGTFLCCLEAFRIMAAQQSGVIINAAPHLKAGMTPDDMAEILLFLADDSGRMLNGTNIEIFSNA